MRHLLRILILFFLISEGGKAQRTFVNLDLYSFFDNTEFGHSAVQIPQTMAGIRFAPNAGFRIDTINSVSFGINTLHEFGSNKAFGDFFPTVFYEYNKKPFRFIMGAFPRNSVMERYPRSFFQDSLTYYRPNINGILWDYKHEKMQLSLWLDWTSRQSPEMHEAFLIGFSGKAKPGILYFQQFTYMFHFAGKMKPAVEEALHDNILTLTSAGLDFSGITNFDRLEINGGWIAGLERARSDGTGWIVQNGFLSEAVIEFRWVGLFNSFYTGKGMMHFYKDHGNELYWGDPFYRARTYNRSDFYIDFIRRKGVSARLIYSLHFAEGNIYNEQALKVTVNFNNPGL